MADSAYLFHAGGQHGLRTLNAGDLAVGTARDLEAVHLRQCYQPLVGRIVLGHAVVQQDTIGHRARRAVSGRARDPGDVEVLQPPQVQPTPH